MAKLSRITFVAAALCLAAPREAAADDLDKVLGIIGTGATIFLDNMQQNQPIRRVEPQRPAPPRAAPRRPSAEGGQQRRLERSEEAVQRRADRMEIQRRLNALGFDAGPPDGIFGPRTRRAIAEFQRSIGRAPDGRISPAEIAILYERSEGAGGSGFAALSGSRSGGMPPLQGPGASAGGGGFPALGSAPGEKRVAAGGFPALGVPAEVSQGGSSAFPGLATPTGDAAAASATAFPAIGAQPAAKPGESPAFPALGSVQPAADGEAMAMPALGAVPEKQGEPAFPAIAGVKEEAGDEPKMPGLAPAPDAQAEKPAMPGLAAVPEPEDPAMPGLGAAPEQKASAMPELGAAPEMPDPAAVTFDAALAKTPFGTRQGQPAILGLTLGQEAGKVEGTLAAAGFAGCETTQGRVSCLRETATLTDRISVWADKEGVWAVLRSIDFAEPAPADLVMQQFQGSYPTLMRLPGQMASSAARCSPGMLVGKDPAAVLEEMAVVRNSPETKAAAGGTAVEFARTCPLAYLVDLDGADTITSARILFVDATAVIRRLAAEEEKTREAEEAIRKRLSNDLKL